MPLGLLTFHLGLQHGQVELIDLLVHFLEFTLFVDQVRAQFVDLVVLRAAIFEVVVELISFESVVLLEPHLVFA